MVAVRRSLKDKKVISKDMVASGLPSANYGKPFAYNLGCIPGVQHKLDSSRSTVSNSQAVGGANATSRSREFMMGLSNNLGGGSEAANLTAREPFNSFGHDLVTNPYSLHQTSRVVKE